MAETLPADVWHNILNFACTDGGYTSRALARVSKTIRALSAAHRFHSVRLSKLSTIKKFLAVYEAALAVAAAASDGSDPPRVRHLLLRFLPHETDVTLLEGPFHFRDFYSWTQAKDAWNAELVALLGRLFALTRAHLDTLAVLQSDRVPLPFLRVDLPALRTLTLLADDRVFVRCPDEPRSDNGWTEPSNTNFYATAPPTDDVDASFPALERLHLVDGPNKRLPWALTLPVWGRLAPRVAHLQVSHADKSTLRAVLDVVRASPPVFAALRTVAVQGASDGPDSAAGVVEIQEACTRRVEGGGVKFVHVPSSKVAEPRVDWPTLLAREWEEV
ncbi:hypothetical protein C8Q79DRAFT_785380 [Trametes meyenii]|nr:hypothetical protein C8Q79DRAFT_785380 [Trametes meyenii]